MFLQRFYIYQQERFPLLAHGLLITAFSFSAVAYSRVCRQVQGFIDLPIFCWGVFNTVTLFLLLRIFDEFKDAEDDARYRQDLPVPRGLVTLKELGTLGVCVVLAQIAVNLLVFPKMLWLYALVLGYMSLMAKEFFIRDWLKKHQFWYVVSHMLIIPLVDMYASGLDWHLAGKTAPQGLLFFFAVSFMNGIVLEVGRKIRTPEQESEGVLTYSGMLGADRAVYLWLLMLLLTCAFSVSACLWAGYKFYPFVALGILLLVCALPAFLFLNGKSPKKAKAIEYASALWTVGMYITLGSGFWG